MYQHVLSLCLKPVTELTYVENLSVGYPQQQDTFMDTRPPKLNPFIPVSSGKLWEFRYAYFESKHLCLPTQLRSRQKSAVSRLLLEINVKWAWTLMKKLYDLPVTLYPTPALTSSQFTMQHSLMFVCLCPYMYPCMYVCVCVCVCVCLGASVLLRSMMQTLHTLMQIPSL